MIAEVTPGTVFLPFLMIIMGFIGSAIGNINRQGRQNAGFFLGAFLGPVGWIIAALLKPID